MQNVKSNKHYHKYYHGYRMNNGDIVSMIYDPRKFVLRFRQNDEKIMINDIVNEVDLDYKLCVIVCCSNKKSMKN